MKRQKSHLTTRNQPALLQTVAGYCLAAIFSFLFLSSQALNFGDTKSGDFESGHNAYSLLSTGDVGGDHQPLYPPIGSDPLPLEPETPDEGESKKDSSADEFGKLFCNFPLERYLGPRCGITQFSQLKLAIESRPAISLFVLHHSWKSFLI